MARVLILGSSGMLGQALSRDLKQEHSVIGIDRGGADYCFDLLSDEALMRCIDELRPDVIVNTAAIVNLDLCEQKPGEAYLINSRLPAMLADISHTYGTYLVQISTDHYYQGDKNTKHNEEFEVQLVNEYARTKYIGEVLSLQYANTLVLRTNIVGFRGKGSPTFVEWVIDSIKKKESLTLYNDFYTSSIHVNDFASVFSDLIKMKPTGIYNLASSEVSNKKEFILALSDAVFGFHPDYAEGSVKKINGTPRGDSLGLDVSKIEKLLGYSMPDLKDTVKSIVEEYKRRERIS